jgi:membrane protease subunit (stomatin/prohibitin family)
MPVEWIDRLKWDNPGTDLVWKYPKEDLTTLTQLIVNESQSALLYKNGQAFDVYKAGRHTLSTANIPLLNKLVNLPFDGKTPFAAEVWFVNHAIPLNLKFGTATPLQLEDPVYQIVVPVRAYGQFGLEITDPGLFVQKLVGVMSSFDQAQVVDYFKGVMMAGLKSRIASAIVHGGLSVLEIETQLDTLSRSMEEGYQPDFKEYGLTVRTFRLMSISVPEDDPSVVTLKEAKATAARRRIEGTNFQQDRMLEVLEKGAGNEGTGGMFASAGLGLGMGASMGQVFQQGLQGSVLGGGQQPPASPGTPPPSPFGQGSAQFFIHLNGEQKGPYGMDVLQQGVPTGEFTAETPVWRQGMQSWTPAGQVPELSSLFQASPPPFGGGGTDGGNPPPFGG